MTSSLDPPAAVFMTTRPPDGKPPGPTSSSPVGSTSISKADVRRSVLPSCDSDSDLSHDLGGDLGEIRSQQNDAGNGDAGLEPNSLIEPDDHAQILEGSLVKLMEGLSMLSHAELLRRECERRRIRDAWETEMRFRRAVGVPLPSSAQSSQESIIESRTSRLDPTGRRLLEPISGVETPQRPSATYFFPVGLPDATRPSSSSFNSTSNGRGSGRGSISVPSWGAQLNQAAGDWSSGQQEETSGETTEANEQAGDQEPCPGGEEEEEVEAIQEGAADETTVVHYFTPLFVRSRTSTPQVLTVATNKAVQKVLRRPLLSKDRGGNTGYIYVFTLPNVSAASPPTRHVKIGFTQNSVEERMAAISYRCKFTPVLLHKVRTPCPRKVEALVHAHLRQHRRCEDPRCPGCGLVHKEWFEVDGDEAERVVDMWASWVTKYDPYDGQGVLRRGWHAKVGAVCWVDLRNPECWETALARWMRVSRRMAESF